jgi:hypothetical protein
MTKRPWGVHDINDVIAPSMVGVRLPDGQYGRAVPEPYTANRVVAAWWVLTGRAYALQWPDAEALNRALGWVPEKTRLTK